MSVVYLDTSVLAKRYLPTPQSEAIEAILGDSSLRFVVSEISAVELESTLQRRGRERSGRSIDKGRVRMRIDDDIRSGFFAFQPLHASTFSHARRLIADGAPLATLDALHLAAAIEAESDTLATDDRQLARAARAAGLRIKTFI